MRKSIQIIECKNGFSTIIYNGRLIHSKYNPIEEARKFVKSFKIDNYQNVLIVYGLGLGYHIYEMLDIIGKGASVHIFEFNEELVDKNKELGVLSEICKDSRVKCYFNYYEDINKFTDLMNKECKMIIHEPSLSTLDDSFKGFKGAIERYNIARKAIYKFEGIMQNNSYRNKELKDELITGFIEKNLNTKTVCLVAAGPSLDLRLVGLKSLKKLKSEVKIFAVGRALGALIENDIMPDMICEIDPQDLVYTHIEKYKKLQIPLCYLSTTNYLTTSNYEGKRYIFYNDDGCGEFKIETGKSVATAILSIAIKCKPDNIIFLGQDLAFINGVSHTKFADYDNVTNLQILPEVKGVNGETLKTTNGLLYFKEWIENTININKSINFYNCSDGAIIKGTKHISIDEVINIIYKGQNTEK